MAGGAWPGGTSGGSSGGLNLLWKKGDKLDSACFKGDLAKLKKLLAKGYNPNTPATDPKLIHRKPLHAAALASQVHIVDELFNTMADIDCCDDLGRTPLHYVAAKGDLRMLELLLEKGADYTIRDRYGNLAVHMAVAARQTAVKERLVGQALEQSMEFSFFENGTWQPFEESAARLLAFELAEGVGFAALQTSAGATYIVDFVYQYQVNVSSLFSKSVSWRVLPRGKWNRPPQPFQGLHPGSQDARYLLRYDALLKDMQSQGIAVCPIYFSQVQLVSRPGQSHVMPEPFNRSLAPIANPNAATGSFQRSPSWTQQASFANPNSLPRSSSAAGVSYESGDDSVPSTPLSRSFRDGSIAAAMAPMSLAAASGGEPTAPPISASSESGSEVGDGGSYQLFQTLRSGSDEFNEIVARFVSGMEGSRQARLAAGPGEDPLRPVTVSAVYRALNPASQVRAFEAAKEHLSRTRGDANERLAWHGARHETLEKIVAYGFELSRLPQNGRLFGKGVYLAPEGRAYTSAEFALPDSDGAKHMLLCRVVLGSMEEVLFESSQSRPSSMRFDTGTDKVQDPTRYVVWEEDMNDFILPTHLISFRYC